MKSKRRFFDFPDIYNITLRAPYERIETAVNSIRWLIARRGIAKGRILELACGICTHGILLAQALSITGIDISQRMLDGAKHCAEATGVEIEQTIRGIRNAADNE